MQALAPAILFASLFLAQACVRFGFDQARDAPSAADQSLGEGTMTDAARDQGPPDLPASDHLGERASDDGLLDRPRSERPIDLPVSEAGSPDLSVDTTAPDLSVDTTAPDLSGDTTAADAGTPVWTHAWSQRFGGISEEHRPAVAVAGDDTVYLIGSFAGTAAFGGSTFTSANDDIVLAHYDANGAHLFSRQFGSASEQHGRAIAVNSVGYLFLAGDFYSSLDLGGATLMASSGFDVFFASLSATGAHRFSRNAIGTGSDFSVAVALDEDGNVYFVGNFGGEVDFGGGPLTSAGGQDAFLASYTQNGVFRFAHRFGGTGHDYPYSVRVDSAGNVYVAGTFRGSADFGGGPLTSAGGIDVFSVSFNQSGAHRFSRRYGTVGDDYCYATAVDAAGNVYLAGSFAMPINFGGGVLDSVGAHDVFLASHTQSGSHVFSTSFGASADDHAYDVVVDSSDNVLLVGTFNGVVDFGGGPYTSAGAQDVYLAVFDASGAHRFSRRFGGPSDDIVYSIALDSADNIYLTGLFEDSVDFGGGPLTSAGFSDMFLVKLTRP